jgi:ABC-type antimicrobial peptide transport system permease subunit
MSGHSFARAWRTGEIVYVRALRRHVFPHALTPVATLFWSALPYLLPFFLSLLVFALVFSVVLGALAAAYATLRIAHLSPADAIRRGT